LLASKLLGVREEDVVYEILDNMEHPSSFNSVRKEDGHFYMWFNMTRLLSIRKDILLVKM